MRRSTRSAGSPPAPLVFVDLLEPRRLLAAVLPNGFVESQIASGLVSPTAMDFAPDGRLFVTLQNGTIRVVEDDVLLPTAFATVNENSEGERGLLGITFDPDFENNQFVYVYYTAQSTLANPNPHNVVSRFVADGNIAVPDNEEILFELPSIGSAIWHMGGAIHFGDDGKLYIAIGDYQTPANSQSLSVVMGKILRINADGTIPSDNPFYNQTTGINQSIWAIGLRNPFTTAIEPGTGRLYINDVGEGSWEEVNQGAPAANFGWPTTEGNFNQAQFPNFTRPIHTYPHSQGCSIIGGGFYSGVTLQFPSQYHGKYFFADFCNGRLQTMDTTSHAVSTFATGLSFPTAIAIAPDGSVWHLDRGQGTGGQPSTGSLLKIRYTLNQPPTIDQDPQDTVAVLGEDITFTVSASGTPPLSYQWQRDDVDIAGATSSSYTLQQVTEADAGARFRVIVTSPFGSSTSDDAALSITTNQRPNPVILTPAEGTTYAGGQLITYSAVASDPEDGDLPASAFTWWVDLHHDQHAHPFRAETSGSTSGQFTIATTGHTETNVWYRINVRVVDNEGLTRAVFRDVHPRTSTMTLKSNIPGLQLNLDSQPRTTPIAIPGVHGITRTLEAPAIATADGVSYQFLSWSDGGARTHTIAFPNTDSIYTAIYHPFGETYLSDMTPLSAVNGWGPYERDQSNGEQLENDGSIITLGGVTYDKGLGVHAQSELAFALDGRFNTFVADVGVDAEVGNNGSVNFQVFTDGVLAYDSGTLTGASPTAHVVVTVTGKTELRLVVTNGGDNINFDHADWAAARLLTTVGVPIGVNFTAPGGEAFGGYLQDTGLVYANRGGNVSYGWLVDNTANGRDRDAVNSPDERYDSFTHLQKPGRDDVWELGLPNGTYWVHIVGGDPSFYDGDMRLSAEGVVVVNGIPSAAAPWVEGSAAVTVADGRLTVRSAPGAVNAKINFIDVSPMVPAPPPPSAPAAPQLTPASPTRIDVSWQPVSGATLGYVLERSTDGGVTYIPIAETAEATTSFSDTGVTTGQTYHYRVRAAGEGGHSNASPASSITTTTAAAVVARQVFYNDSALDGNDPGASAVDDAAIASGKSPLLPGGMPLPANVIAVAKGINGLMIDIAGLPPGAEQSLDASDFTFRTAPGGDPATWPAAPAPTTIAIRRGAGAAPGSDRVTLIWSDEAAVKDAWLEVTVNANPDTGLAAADVSYFAHLTADANGDRTVSVADVGLVSTNFGLAERTPDQGDFTGDGEVTVGDVGILSTAFGRTLDVPMFGGNPNLDATTEAPLTGTRIAATAPAARRAPATNRRRLLNR